MEDYNLRDKAKKRKKIKVKICKSYRYLKKLWKQKYNLYTIVFYYIVDENITLAILAEYKLLIMLIKHKQNVDKPQKIKFLRKILKKVKKKC